MKETVRRRGGQLDEDGRDDIFWKAGPSLGHGCYIK